MKLDLFNNEVYWVWLYRINDELIIFKFIICIYFVLFIYCNLYLFCFINILNVFDSFKIIMVWLLWNNVL